jgi:hypothetical protein
MSLKKPLRAWQQLSRDEKIGTAAIFIYVVCVLNWISCRYVFGGIDFESERVKAWADLVVVVLPFLWLATSKSKRPRAIDERRLGMLFFACLFLLSFLNFFIRSTPDLLIRETKLDRRASIKLYENGGSALDMPSRCEQAETNLLPGIKWMRVTRTIGWREFIPE